MGGVKFVLMVAEFPFETMTLFWNEARSHHIAQTSLELTLAQAGLKLFSSVKDTHC